MSTPPELQEKLDKINDDFHAAIDQKKHCYQREPGEDMTCDCEYFYDLWVTVRADFERTK